MAEPQNLRATDELRFLSGAEISPRLGFSSEIKEAIEKCYGELKGKTAGSSQELPFIDQMDVSGMQFFTASASDRNRAAMAEFEAELRNERTPTVRLVSAILCAAASKKASDVHIETHAFGTVVRMSVDVVLRELTRLPSE